MINTVYTVYIYIIIIHYNTLINYNNNKEKRTLEWPASLQCKGPRGRSTSWSRWRQRWRAAPRPGRSHRKPTGRRSYGPLPLGSWWMCTIAGSTDTPSDGERKYVFTVATSLLHHCIVCFLTVLAVCTKDISTLWIVKYCELMLIKLVLMWFCALNLMQIQVMPFNC